MTMPVVRKLRCAVYTRKSTEEGLDMEFNSLDAQRESCEAYVASQRAEGWLLVRDRYDDGGYSGGTIERPALQRLLADVQAGLVDVVVVYKIDRLSRALMDFAKIVEIFERHGVTFVSVTQSFNTTTSMGRLTLNMLLSFAQFEREVIGERIRDKVAASRKRGIWMGGWAPFGYVVKERKLIVQEDDAKTVRMIFRRFVTLRSTTLLARELAQKNVRNRYGRPIDKGALYKLLGNRVYRGEAVHKDQSYPGEHLPIIDQKLWNQVHAVLKDNPWRRSGTSRAQTPALLKGLIFDASGVPMSPTHTRRRGKHYRYYVSQQAIDGLQPNATKENASLRVPAGEIESIVIGQLRRVIISPEIIVATWKQLRKSQPNLAESSVRTALVDFSEVWDALFPAEQSRIANLLIDRVVVLPTRVDVHLLIEGLGSLAAEIRSTASLEGAA